MTRRAAALGAVLVVAAACGGSESGSPPTTSIRLVDAREVESVVVATQRRSSPDLAVGPASCPQGVVVTEGATLTCSVAVENASAPYLVTVHDDGGSRRLRYDVRPAKAILLVPRVVDAIRRSSSSGSVDCGPERVRVVDVGGTFDCFITRPEGAKTVRVVVETVDGNVSFKET